MVLKIILPVIIVVIVAVAGIVGYFTLQTQSPSPKTASLPTITPSSTLSPIIRPSPTPSPTTITPTFTTSPLPATFVTREKCRDLVMIYIKENHSDAAVYIGNNIVWNEFRATPPKLLGYETYIYIGENWNLTIGYPVVAPQNVFYKVTAVHTSGIAWTGEVREGKVSETSYNSSTTTTSKATPKLTPSTPSIKPVTEVLRFF